MQDLKTPAPEIAVPRRGVRRSHILIALAGLVLFAATIFTARQVGRSAEPIHIAFAQPRTGSQAFGGAEMLIAAKLYLDEVNRGGGIDGHPIMLDRFENVRAVTDGPALAALGDCLDTLSPPAGASGAPKHIPTLSNQPLAGDLSEADPYCFRVQMPVEQQAQWLAHYIRDVLMRDSDNANISIDLVTAEDVFGKSFASGFVSAMGEQTPETWTLDVHPAAVLVASEVIADALALEPQPRILVIGVSQDSSAALVKAIRRRGIHTTLVLSAASADAYLTNFEHEPEERGFFTANMYIATPMIFDAIGTLGQYFAENYTGATGQRPNWSSAAANDAMRIIVEALRQAHPANTADSKASDREAVRAALARIDSPEQAIAGLDGPLYFNAGRNIARPLRVGYYDRGRLVSAPLQLVSVPHPDLIDLMKGLRTGSITNIGANFFWVQRVVYAGIDIARLNRIDVQAGTFSADVYVWLRYSGETAEPTRIEFPDLEKVSTPGGFFDPAKPIEQGELDGLNYYLYRITGDFKAEFDLHDYPFDTQSLVVRFQNHEQPRQQVAYVTDTFGLRLHRPDQSPLGTRSAFADLQLWHVADLRYFVHAFSISSTQGKPAFFDNDSRIEYGGFDAAIVVRRDVLAFMAKTLAPLFLLVLVVFATLFFPASLAAERTTIPVTGFLTSAVLLVSISNQLPTLGYTMALEYMFYVFFGLCLMTMCAGFVTERLRIALHARIAVAVDQVARIVYVVVVLLTIGGFVWWFALR